MSKTPKRPRDTNQLAKFIVDVATGDREDRTLTPEDEGKDPAAVARGRLGGIKGGKARAAALTKKDRCLQAQKAAKARWSRS